MSKDIIHIGFEDIENEKPYFIEFTEEQKKQFGFDKKTKTVWDYFDSYLNDNKTKKILKRKFSSYINETLPKEVKENCLFCKGNNENLKEEDKKCYNYHIEGQMNEFFAVSWFVSIVENNKHLLSDKETLKRLSIKFYECFLFKGGRVFFNLRKLTMHCLEQGFLTLSKIFSENDKIQNLEIINETLDNLESEYLSIKMFGDSNPYHIGPQKTFFKNKRKSIKEQLKIEKLKKERNTPQQPETDKPDEVYKTQLLFKVGLLFAKGEMNKYFTVNSKGKTVMNNGFTAPKIAKELGNESYNKYILATINNYTPDKENGSKNIFNSFDMMSKIITHCEAENITVDTYFRSRLPIE